MQETSHRQDWLTRRTLDQLARSEVAAAERYRATLDHLDNNEHTAELTGAFWSHVARARMMNKALGAPGVRNKDDLHARRKTAHLVHQTVARMSDRLALANLERLEKRQARRYTQAQKALKEDAFALVEDLIPEQRKVTDMIERLALDEERSAS